jgi:4-amino-4-deoxy-L-arabinose transferase-like glycosyltransferase
MTCLFRTTRSLITVIILTTFIISLPFIDQAFHIDDPLFLEVSRHALPNPVAMYDFTFNWLGRPGYVFDYFSNPPLVPLYIAAVNLVAQDREWLLHLFFIPFFTISTVAFYALAKRFCPDIAADRSRTSALVAAAVFALNPALFVCSHTLMPDVPALAVLLCGMAIAIQGSDKRRPVLLFIGALLAGCAALCKYNGVVSIAIVALYCLLQRAPLTYAIIAGLAASLPTLGWMVISQAYYGTAHIISIAQFQTKDLVDTSWPPKVLFVLGALGFVYGAYFVCMLAARFKALGVIIGVALILPATLHSVGSLKEAPMRIAMDLSPSLLAILLGTAVLIALIKTTFGARFSLSDPQSRDRLFLALWTLSVVGLHYNLLFLAVRYLLPMLPPITLLLLQNAQCQWQKGGLNRPHLAACCIYLLITFGVAASDYTLAGTYRAFAETQARQQPATFFHGHWGFQYYMSKAKIPQQLEKTAPSDRIGERLALADSSCSSFPAFKTTFPFVVTERTCFHSANPLRSLTTHPAAFFHSWQLTGLRHAAPFAFSVGPVECFSILERKPGEFATPCWILNPGLAEELGSKHTDTMKGLCR